MVRSSDAPKQYLFIDDEYKMPKGWTTDINRAYVGNYGECQRMINAWYVGIDEPLGITTVGLLDIEQSNNVLIVNST